MSAFTRLATKIYHLLLACYPPNFRTEFEEEMQDVFATALQEAQHLGRGQLWRLYWREIRVLPGSVLQEHLRERRRKMASNGLTEEKSLSRKEMLAAMIIFLLPLISMIAITGDSPPPWIGVVLLGLFWGGIIFAIGLAVVRGLPRWSLSYLGVVLMLIIIFSPTDPWGWIYTSFIQSFGQRPSWSLPVHIIYAGIFSFIYSLLYLLGALILVNLMRLLPYTRGVWQQIRADWTQLSFMLYGGLVFYIVLVFETYRYEDVWKLAAWLCLGLGAWFYLQAHGGKQRILGLTFGATGAIWIVALAKWVLIPIQDWQSRFTLIPMEDLRWVEASNIMVGWVLFLIILAAPALLNALPQPPNPKEEGTVNA